MEKLKKYKELIILVVAVLCAVIAIAYIMLDPEAEEPQGESGSVIATYDVSEAGDKSIIATVYKDGLLDIVGSGRMRDLSNIPWIDHANVITKAQISNGITNIGRYAFYHLGALSQITIPSSVTEIGEYAFKGCGVQELALPEGLTVIGQFAFEKSFIKSIKLPSTLTEMGLRAFQNCSALTSVEIADGVTKIGDYAFYGCKKLGNIKIPASVTYIGKGAFSGCTEIKTVEFVNTADWKLYAKISDSTGEPVILMFETENAVMLTSSKSDYYWRKG